MKILWLSTRLPYPAHSGGNLVVYPRLVAMAERGHEIHFAAPLESGVDAGPALAHLRSVCASVTTWPRGVVSAKGAVSLPWGAFSRLPPAVTANALRALVQRCDILQVEHTTMVPVAAAIQPRHAPLPMVLTVHGDAREGMARLARARPLHDPRRLGFLAESARFGALDRRVLCDPSLAAALFVSTREHRETACAMPEHAHRFHYLPIGYGLKTTGQDASEAPTVLFVASFLDPGNREAAHWFLRDVWPRVRPARPAVLEIAGRRAASLGIAAPGIRITSDPDSLDPSYARATLCIVPVLGGCGVRLKLLEAIAYGVPVVTTPLGVDGTAFEHGRHLQVAAGAESFAASVMRCLDGGADVRAAAAAARALLARDHDPETIADAFERHLLQACSGAATPLPERNGASAPLLEMSPS